MTLLSLSDLSVRRGDCPVVDHVSFDVQAGECIGLIGPNGAGKTTLLRAALGLLAADGKSSLAALPAHDRARQVAWMPQAREIAWPVSVETLIALGRIPHLPRGSKLRHEDQVAIDAAINRMGLDAYRLRTATQLSGGEQARVLIARALAQDTPLLIADEPIAGLDPANQIATMDVFSGLARDGHSVLVSIHDLGLAARHCTRLLMINRGRLVADGPPAQVLTPENVEQVFGVSAFFQHTPDGPVFQPMTVIQ
ncbi:ABC transporter ATP-binding protein [Phaeobacter marinintestinus]|uniref:ABC transporter ATP-binding protein n=1 Tax=Falsiphaeobacter marinintestinus TaxID=1492905 RepID=UPI0011B374FC|nr:ABC transporter ATP-binding protein [Phaeobacter marinintestinus]